MLPAEFITGERGIILAHSRLERLESYIISIIEDRRTTPGALVVGWFLKQLSRVFAAIVQIRLTLFRQGVFRSHAPGIQVISVGNLTVGGTGKTPVVEVFARSLQQSGRKVAILSRGYKRVKPPLSERMWKRLKGERRKTNPWWSPTASACCLIPPPAGTNPTCWHPICRRWRCWWTRTGSSPANMPSTKLGCDTLILDDGFQYMALKHRLDIALVDRTNPFGNRHMLPRGILREPIRNIRRAGFIFHHQVATAMGPAN